jgi:hypothetical protein
MKVLALALALCFAAVPVQAAVKNKVHHSKSAKVKTKSHVKRANKAGRLKRANKNRVN